MKAAIISYSQTGRNKRLAQMVADELGIENIEVVEKKQREMMTITWDLVLRRVPKVEPAPAVTDEYDAVIFFAPVWMGMAATPLNAYLKYIKKTGKKYAFMSLSGGHNEDNPLLLGDVSKKAGKAPAAFLDLHVADLMENRARTRQQAEAYNMTDAEYEMLCKRYVAVIGEMLK